MKERELSFVSLNLSQLNNNNKITLQLQFPSQVLK